MSSSSSSSSSLLAKVEPTTVVYDTNKDKCDSYNVIYESDTTTTQEETELECQPFFIDLNSLDLNHIEALQKTGLLLSSSSSTGNSSSSGNGGTTTSTGGGGGGNTNTNTTTNNNNNMSNNILLLHQKHYEYVSQVWTKKLKYGFVSLDSSRPWMLYWCLHSCDLLGMIPSNNINEQILYSMVKAIERWYITTSIEIDISTLSTTNDPLLFCNDDNDDDDGIIEEEDDENKNNDNDTTKTKKTKTFIGGGFGGGPGQMAHAATTYASILVLCIIASNTNNNNNNNNKSESSSSTLAIQLLERIRRPLYIWFLSLKQNNGGFRMHNDGEIDIRASYTIICCCKLLNIITSNLFTNNIIQYIYQCQTYEGGFGGEPYTEAHGGYTFCALATLQLLNQFTSLTTTTTTQKPTTNSSSSVVDINTLTGWIARRQMNYEGGFSGRCNKLVDGCYSFWQGSALAILSAIHTSTSATTTTTTTTTTAAADSNNNNNNNEESSSLYEQYKNTINDDLWLVSSNCPRMIPSILLFDGPMLERYILLCAQDVNGGLRDKPSKSRDFYHSCYNLSGLSIAQYYSNPTTTTTTTTISTNNNNTSTTNETTTTNETNTTTTTTTTSQNNNNNNNEQKEQEQEQQQQQQQQQYNQYHYGHPEMSKVHRTHPCYNIRPERVEFIMKHFYK